MPLPFYHIEFELQVHVPSIPGAQIIDLMMLVIDVTKGMQTQTAECLVIGEITCDHLIVVLNKIDQFPEAKRQAAIEKVFSDCNMEIQITEFWLCA